MTDSHFETIKCPNCDHVEEAEVIHSFPWNQYVHHCTNCEYVIMESEWDVQPIKTSNDGKD